MQFVLNAFPIRFLNFVFVCTFPFSADSGRHRGRESYLSPGAPAKARRKTYPFITHPLTKFLQIMQIKLVNRSNRIIAQIDNYL